MEKLLLPPGETAKVMGIGRTKVFELVPPAARESVPIGASRRVPLFAIQEYVARLRSGASR